MHIPSDHEIETVSGKFVDVKNPDPATIDLHDIAHALSQTCRYGGHSKVFFCVPPETPVLTAALEWVPAGELCLGDSLLTLEESTDDRKGTGRKPRRRGLVTSVTHTGLIRRQIVRLDLSDGSCIRASGEHPWLVALKAAGNQSWLPAREILARVERGQAQSLVRLAHPWSTLRSHQAGYLAGLLDGEGHIMYAGGGLFTVVFSQKPGSVLQEFERGLSQLGFSWTTSTHPDSGTVHVGVRGGWQESARLLGSLRPIRLLENAARRMQNTECPFLLPAIERVQVVGGAVEGPGDVVSLSTGEHTYIAGGFLAHNSVAEHAVFVSKRLERQGHNKLIQLAGLHHDDPEAYLQDIPRPFKPLLGRTYERLSDKMDVAIVKALELPFEVADLHTRTIKSADNWSLLLEARYLLPSQGKGWQEGQQGSGAWGLDDQPSRIVTPDYWHGGLTPPIASGMFLARHAELTGPPSDEGSSS